MLSVCYERYLPPASEEFVSSMVADSSPTKRKNAVKRTHENCILPRSAENG